MRLKMLLDTVKQWSRPENGTVSILDLMQARLLDRLSAGLIYILSPVVKVMLKIQSGVSETQYRARVTIARRTIEQIKPIDFEWRTPGCNSQGFLAQTVGTVPFNAGTGLTYTNNIRPNTITFSNNNKPILTITQDGDVEWTGKPSEAADAIVRVLQLRVEDKKGLTKAARRRYYAMACRNILEQAEKMEYEEFLAYLNREVYNRESRVIIDSLKGEEDAG
jgi:hypothetical protein